MTKRHLVIDGNNLLIRSVMAMRHAPLSHDGVPTGALMTFINLVSRYVREVEPTHAIVCWDGGKSTHRVAIFEGYKAARKERPDEDEPQRPFGQAKEFLTLANIHHVEQTGVEADDLVAAYVREQRGQKVILSGDKDFLQLLDGWTEQIRPGSGPDERWTANRVRTAMGCKAEDIPKVMALTGDQGDNVPGIPGFGQKTACKALEEHGWDLAALLDSDNPRWQKKLAFQAEAIERNLKLVDLRTAIPGIEVPEAPPFHPTDPESAMCGPLLDFLAQYDLEHIRQRLMTWTLWSDNPMKEAS